MSWRHTSVAPDRTHHTLDDRPLYDARFVEVLAFHAPGLAAAIDASGATHIDPNGRPAYASRFVRTFGFYEGLAAVHAGDGWHHIRPTGEPLTDRRFEWCGNFQGGLCAVRDAAGRYRHLLPDGTDAYAKTWRYAGDFRGGTAVVQREDGLHSHIDAGGRLVHGTWFVDLDVFHKGFARARDDHGWHHVNREGEPLYRRRFAAVEPFYNGQARVERFDGALEVVDECGRLVLELRPAPCAEPATGRDLDRTAQTWTPDDPEWLARLELTRVSHLLYERGYNVSIDGNVSWRLDDGTLLITPTGAHLGFIEPHQFVVVSPDGELLRGDRAPTSEYRLHVELHRTRPDCRCVVHAHAPHAIAASLAGIDLAQTFVTVAPVPTTEYARISSEQSPDVLRPFMESHNWAILPRHGVVAWAATVWDAFLRVEGLEHYAKVVMAARACGPIEPMTPEQRIELLTFWGLEHLG